MRFADLQWKPHPNVPHRGMLARHAYSNGWEVSFLSGDFSIHMKPGIYEAQPWKPDGEIAYDTDLEGPFYGNADTMQHIMDRVEAQNNDGS